MNELLNQIAVEKLGLLTLEPRGRDHLDFSQQAVWTLRAALQTAFEAGRAAAGKPQRYRANFNGRAVMVTIPQD